MSGLRFQCLLLAALSSVCLPGCITVATGVVAFYLADEEKDPVYSPEPSNPVISGVMPSNGPQSGGIVAAIYGYRFKSGCTVFFGAAQATLVSVVSQYEIRCSVPAGQGGAVDVTVTNPDLLSFTLEDGFIYNPSPVIATASPNWSPLAGGTAITLTGANFQSGAVVSIGGTPASSVVVLDSASITCIAPAGSPGAADVQVTNPDGESGTYSGGIAYLASGSLVPGFGLGGGIGSNPGTSNDYAYAVAVDSSNIYVAGEDYNTGSYEWRIEKRSLSDGSLVLGFGTQGVISGDYSTSGDGALAMAIDLSYMYVAGVDSVLGNRRWRIEKRNLSDGTLVSGFGTGGVVTSNPSVGDDYIYAIALDSSCLYAVGSDYGPGNWQWRIEKRNLSDGALVASFGTGGVVTVNPSTWSDSVRAVALDATHLYLAGYDYAPGNYQWRIEKRNLSDGSLVAAFVSNPSSYSDQAWAIAVDGSGIYVGGVESDLASWMWRIEKRSKTDGSLVQGFGVQGAVRSDLSQYDDRIYALVLDSSFLYAAGYDRSPGNNQWRLEKRKLSDGSLVSGFGVGGAVTGNHSALDDYIYGLAIDSMHVYAVGVDSGPGNVQWRIEKRFLTDGTSGIETENPTTAGDGVFAAAADSGSLYLAGADSAPGDFEWRAEKRGCLDGRPAASFGTAGVATVNPSAADDSLNAIALDSGYVYLAGGQGASQWRIEKRGKSDGLQAAGFGSGGAATSDPGPGNDEATAIAVDSTYMYVAGSDTSPGNVQWRIEKRLLSDGSLVAGFGTGGAVTSNPGSGDDFAYAIAIDTTYIYVAGTDASGGNAAWRIEKRNLSDGALVAAFGTGGIAASNPSTGDDEPAAIAVNSSYIYIAGWDSFPGDMRWRIEKYNKTTGALDAGFGTGGAVTSDPGTGDDCATALLIDSTFAYVAGYDSSQGDHRWRVEKRSLADGSLDAGFGSGGFVASNPSAANDRPWAIASDGTCIFIAGWDVALGDEQWRVEKRLK